MAEARGSEAKAIGKAAASASLIVKNLQILLIFLDFYFLDQRLTSFIYIVKNKKRFGLMTSQFARKKITCKCITV